MVTADPCPADTEELVTPTQTSGRARIRAHPTNVSTAHASKLAIRILGLKQSKKAHRGDPIALHEMLVDGLPRSALATFVRYSSLPRSDVAQALRISERTLHRLLESETKKSTLTAKESSDLWEFAEIYARACDVFGSSEAADSWLQSPALALDGHRPIDLLKSAPGTRMVTELLDRLDYGVYT